MYVKETLRGALRAWKVNLESFGRLRVSHRVDERALAIAECRPFSVISSPMAG
jgi:hypothetical protein